MAYIAVDKNEEVFIYEARPVRGLESWIPNKESYTDCVQLTKNFTEKYLDVKLTWEDEPYEIQ